MPPLMAHPQNFTASGPRKSLDQQGFEMAATAHERFLKGQPGARAILRFIHAPGVKLPRRVLNDADLTGAVLAGGMFAGCHFERASLQSADLTGCDLRASNLRRSDL